MTQSTEFLIPSRNIERLRGCIGDLARKAQKLGLPPIRLEVVRTEMREVRKRRSEPVGGLLGPEDIELRQFHVVKVTGEKPVVAGYTFMAALEPTLKGNIIRGAPGEGLPKEYRTSESKCDHCKTVRTRHLTFVVKGESGEYKQVGSTCLKDFTGTNASPEGLARWFEDVHEAVQSAMAESFFSSWGIGGAPSHYKLDAYLAYVAEAINRFGWVSMSKVREDPTLTPTAYKAQDSMIPPRRGSYTEMQEWREKRLVPSEASKATAKVTVQWVLDTYEAPGYTPSDYEHNVLTIARNGAVAPGDFGIAASMVEVHLREQRKLKEAASISNSQKFGEPGRRYRLSLRLYDIRILQASPGTPRPDDQPMALLKFRDEAGNVFVTFTGADRVRYTNTSWGKTEEKWYVKTDQAYTVTGTVKRHDEFRGVPQTILTRCQWEEAGPEAAKAPHAELKQAKKAKPKGLLVEGEGGQAFQCQEFKCNRLFPNDAQVRKHLEQFHKLAPVRRPKKGARVVPDSEILQTGEDFFLCPRGPTGTCGMVHTGFLARNEVREHLAEYHHENVVFPTTTGFLGLADMVERNMAHERRNAVQHGLENVANLLWRHQNPPAAGEKLDGKKYPLLCFVCGTVTEVPWEPHGLAWGRPSVWACQGACEETWQRINQGERPEGTTRRVLEAVRKAKALNRQPEEVRA